MAIWVQRYEKTCEMQKENLFFFSFPSASTFGMAKGEKTSEKPNLFELFRDGVPSAEPKYEKSDYLLAEYRNDNLDNMDNFLCISHGYNDNCLSMLPLLL